MRRARAVAWMFAALVTVEPPIVERSMATLVERDKSWHVERLPILDDRVRVRLRVSCPHTSATPTGSMARSARPTF